MNTSIAEIESGCEVVEVLRQVREDWDPKERQLLRESIKGAQYLIQRAFQMGDAMTLQHAGNMYGRLMLLEKGNITEDSKHDYAHHEARLSNMVKDGMAERMMHECRDSFYVIQEILKDSESKTAIKAYRVAMGMVGELDDLISGKVEIRA